MKRPKQDAWQAQHTTWISIRIQNASGIPDALQQALASGKTKNGFIIEAIREKLIREGYMPEKSMPENQE